jgi:hypothetical protein
LQDSKRANIFKTIDDNNYNFNDYNTKYHHHNKIKHDVEEEKQKINKKISYSLTAGYFMNAAIRCSNEIVYKSLPLGFNIIF